MKRYLLDTGTVGDFLARRKGVFERSREELVQGNRIGICVPVLAELYYGIELSQSREKNLKRLQRNLPVLIIWPLTKQLRSNMVG
jgi:tRNA(fMet)-specific endonuclease VapC